MPENGTAQSTFGNVTIGMTAPDFYANTTQGVMRLSDYRGKWLVFFSHPSDFTPVCTTEFIAFEQAKPEFESINTLLLGLSIDSNTSHLAWLESIKETYGVTITFPLIADRSGEIARMYGMIIPTADKIATVRDVFIIDPSQIVRAVLIYPNSTGRNINEIIRIVKALQLTDRDGVVTPANWMPNDLPLAPPPNTYNQLNARETATELDKLYCENWYMCYANSAPKK